MNKQYVPGRVNPQQFGLWISMASLLMMFMAFTSAYIVRHAAGNWLEFAIPNIFVVSTIVIIASSFAVQGSFYFYGKKNEILYKVLLVVGFLLGLAFLVLQYKGWSELADLGVGFKVNPSASFFYIINWVHAAHIVAGLTTLIIAMLHAFTLKFEYTVKRRNRFILVVQFWHFLGFLWIFIYGFLLLTR